MGLQDRFSPPGGRARISFAAAGAAGAAVVDAEHGFPPEAGSHVGLHLRGGRSFAPPRLAAAQPPPGAGPAGRACRAPGAAQRVRRGGWTDSVQQVQVFRHLDLLGGFQEFAFRSRRPRPGKGQFEALREACGGGLFVGDPRDRPLDVLIGGVGAPAPGALDQGANPVQQDFLQRGAPAARRSSTPPSQARFWRKPSTSARKTEGGCTYLPSNRS